MTKQILFCIFLGVLLIFSSVFTVGIINGSRVETLPRGIYADYGIENPGERVEGEWNFTKPEFMTVEEFMRTLALEQWFGYQQVNVLVAADEEMRSHLWYMIPGPFPMMLPWWHYAKYEIERSLYTLHKYGIWFEIVAYVEWNSDQEDPYDMLFEMEADLGWEIGKKYDGYRCDILIGWTDDDNFKPLAGLAHVETETHELVGAVLIHPQADWADDNLVLHEVTHLYNTTDHYYGNPHYDDDCVMSAKEYWIDWYWEDGHLYLLEMYVAEAFLTYNYCSECSELVSENKAWYGVYHKVWIAPTCWSGWNTWPPPKHLFEVA